MRESLLKKIVDLWCQIHAIDKELEKKCGSST